VSIDGNVGLWSEAVLDEGMQGRDAAPLLSVNIRIYRMHTLLHLSPHRLPPLSTQLTHFNPSLCISTAS
jgi:hypothetical protein